MGRALILVLDSFGIGASADAEAFGDEGSDTLGHIAEYCLDSQRSSYSVNPRQQTGPLHLPHLASLGLYHAARDSQGAFPAGVFRSDSDQGSSVLADGSQLELQGAYGYAKELSTGKDTSSGHWEMAGVPVLFEWTYFTEKTNSFPVELLERIIKRARLPGVLGNCHASGTHIIAELGEEHIFSGKPIFYTSADSVVQIACHEESYGLQALLDLCELVREELDGLNVARVIARPFLGSSDAGFSRTSNRRDYSVLPPSPTLLDKVVESGADVISVGKISDIFAGQGISRRYKASGIDGLFDTTLEALKSAKSGDLVFTNFVDFDSSYGHRRDVEGYAAALEHFDTLLPRMFAAMDEDDVLILTADHGCDPTWPGSDHTREHIPVLVYGKGVTAGSLGVRESFADIGQSVANYLSIAPLEYGNSFLPR